MVTKALAYEPKNDIILYGDQYGTVRSLTECLTNIVKENATNLLSVEYEDPKSLPLFSFNIYKKKKITLPSEKKKKQKTDLPLFSLGELGGVISSGRESTKKETMESEVKK